jgi:dephospho-CoA kinase
MIIGITGTLGAGKGTAAQYLVKRHNFMYLSVRNFIAAEVLKRGLVVNRDTITQVANDLRAQHTPEWIVEQLLSQALLQTQALRQRDVVIESIRSVGEAQILKSKGATLWAVDADVHERYRRIVSRASETDSVSFEKFQADEAREWSNTDPAKQNLKGVIEMADVVLTNNGTQEELFAQVEEALKSGLTKSRI